MDERILYVYVLMLLLSLLLGLIIVIPIIAGRAGRINLGPLTIDLRTLKFWQRIAAVITSALTLIFVLSFLLFFPLTTMLPMISATMVPPTTATMLPTPTATMVPPTTATMLPTPTATMVPPTTATMLPTPTATTPTGRLEVTYSSEVIVEEAAVVTVEIIPDRTFNQPGIDLAARVFSIEETRSQSKNRITITDTIRLYPVMSAELIAVNFDIIKGDADPRRAITPATRSVSWTWNIAAKKPGMQKITINIFGEMTIDGGKFTVLEMSKSRNVNVLEKPLVKRIWDGLVNNLPAVIGSGGLVGLITACLTYLVTRRETGKLKETIESLERRIGELEARANKATKRSR